MSPTSRQGPRLTGVAAIRSAVDGNAVTMALCCLLGVASYFFGRPSAIELHWFWVALGAVCIAGLSILQFARGRKMQRASYELNVILDAVPHLVFFKDSRLRYRVLN